MNKLKCDLKKVTVLMSTYNGEKYLRRQIDSILNQKGVNLELVIRDDGSKDNTVRIIKEYIDNHDNIKLIVGDNLGHTRSFLWLMRNYHDSEFYALADQDDIWDEDKLIVAINMISQYGNKKPILYYSNLRIVDENENFCRLSHSIPHTSRGKYASLVESLATGCTVVYNNKLSKIAHLIKPEDFVNHDSWAYTVCRFWGKVVYDFEPHISYRQHSNNAIGAAKKKIAFSRIMIELKAIMKENKIWSKSGKQFLEQFDRYLSVEEKEEIIKLVGYDRGLVNKVRFICNRKFNSDSIYTNVRYRLKVLCSSF